MKIKNGTKREAYSMRLDPDLVTELKHLAVDQKKTLSELVEEGIKMVLSKQKPKPGRAEELHSDDIL